MFSPFRLVGMKTLPPRVFMSVWLIGVTLSAITPFPAAAITPREYQGVGVSLPADAAVPAGVAVVSERGQPERLGSLIKRPTVLVLSDYRCKTLCGPILDFVVSALQRSGLQAGDQFDLLIVGLDPRDSADDARASRNQHLADDQTLSLAITFVTADKSSIDRLTTALGYRYIYDADADQLVHPAAAFILRADRRVSRVLTGVGLSGADMRLALVEAGDGKIGNLSDRVRLLCSTFDPAQGIYTPLINKILVVSSSATLVLLVGGIGFLAFLNRRSAQK